MDLQYLVIVFFLIIIYCHCRTKSFGLNILVILQDEEVEFKKASLH